MNPKPPINHRSHQVIEELGKSRDVPNVMWSKIGINHIVLKGSESDGQRSGSHFAHKSTLKTPPIGSSNGGYFMSMHRWRGSRFSKTSKNLVNNSWKQAVAASRWLNWASRGEGGWLIYQIEYLKAGNFLSPVNGALSKTQQQHIDLFTVSKIILSDNLEVFFLFFIQYCQSIGYQQILKIKWRGKKRYSGHPRQTCYEGVTQRKAMHKRAEQSKQMQETPKLLLNLEPSGEEATVYAPKGLMWAHFLHKFQMKGITRAQDPTKSFRLILGPHAESGSHWEEELHGGRRGLRGSWQWTHVWGAITAS